MQARWRSEPGGRVSGTLTVPGDKSVSHRSLMLGGIAEGLTRVQGFLESEDCLATLRALEAMGVGIERQGSGAIVVRGRGLSGLSQPAHSLDMGNAGTAIRLFTGLLCGQRFSSELFGDASLMKRPMERVARPLRDMGAMVHTTDGRPPVTVEGGRLLRGIQHQLEVASAQVKSAILLAGLYAEGETTVLEPAVTRDHTERMLRAFGVRVESSDLRVRLWPGPLTGCDLTVPGDFSSAAFFIVAALLAGEGPVEIRAVGVNPTRTGLLDILRLMGARIEVCNQRRYGDEPVADLHVYPGPLNGIDVPVGLVPLAIDEFPVLFVAAAAARGVTRVTGAAELRVKESDRIGVMAEGLRALGIRAEPSADGMLVEGGDLQGGVIDSHGDHRIAMSFAVAGLVSRQPIQIDDTNNVATSFPGFLDLARTCGFRLAPA
ncbi:MAG: 3-phosphoshikimate 1-carboxyvinyltransferase [Steroidobacteraceae bacterium]